MKKKQLASSIRRLMSLIAILAAGCESESQRLADYAERATEQQARQNDRIAQQADAVGKHSQELNSAAQELVKQDAAARRDLIDAQQTLQQHVHLERASIDRQREYLDAERKSALLAALREPLLAQAMLTIGLLLAALLPLLVTGYALHKLPERGTADDLLTEAVIAGLAMPRPVHVDPALEQPSLSGALGLPLQTNESTDCPPMSI